LASPSLVRQLKHCPDLFDLAEAYPDRYPYLLENSDEPSALGHFDILFAFPGSQLTCLANGSLLLDGKETGKKSFLDMLDSIYQQHQSTIDGANEFELPFYGGWFLYLGYELVEEIEPVLSTFLHQPELPRAMMIEIPAGIVRNRATGKDYVFASGDAAAERLDTIIADASLLFDGATARKTENEPLCCAIREQEGEHYLQSINKIKDYVRAGDVFQVNLSRRWQADCNDALSVTDAWRRLRQSNPAPFAAWARLDDKITILSSSPERLLEQRQRRVRTRPIAGTYPRSDDQKIDSQLSAELLLHPKERAEHIMLVDLERNDLGRICQPGSIQVDDLMVLESYAHVHHIVSGVSGMLKEGVLPGEIISAVFPGGTITGCPKVRCMEIIAELETEARDAYTGSVGYLCYNGDMDLNILIRTIIYDNDRYTFRAGAGIVADSDPQRELDETRSKARGLISIFSSV
jgi:anthranilate synthase component 1